MYDETIIEGWIAFGEEPIWDPLEKLLPLLLCGPFMWMHSTTLDNGIEIQAYKHSATRDYLLVDDEGDAWERLDRGWYRRMRHHEAIEFVFSPTWLLVHATKQEQAAVKIALESAWSRGNGDQNAAAHILPCSPASPFRKLPEFRAPRERFLPAVAISRDPEAS